MIQEARKEKNFSFCDVDVCRAIYMYLIIHYAPKNMGTKRRPKNILNFLYSMNHRFVKITDRTQDLDETRSQ